MELFNIFKKKEKAISNSNQAESISPQEIVMMAHAHQPENIYADQQGQHLDGLVKPKKELFTCSCCNREISKDEIKEIGSNTVCEKCVWIYDKIVALKNSAEPNKKPSEPLIVKRTVLKEIKPANSASFSFEKDALIIEIVLEKQSNQKFVRITKYSCYAENNGRAQYRMSKSYYKLSQVDLRNISSDNYRQKIIDKPIYDYTEYNWGCLY